MVVNLNQLFNFTTIYLNPVIIMYKEKALSGMKPVGAFLVLKIRFS